MKRGSYFSTYHLYSAIHNARIAGEIEEGVRGKENDDIFRGESVSRWQPIHDSHVMTTFAEAFSSIEVTINEFYHNPSGEVGLSIAEFESQFPTDFTYGMNTFEKYQIILAISNKEMFDTGEEPYQSADLLRRIRNYFVHHEETKISQEDIASEEPAHKLGQALVTKDASFDNPFSSEDQPVFPRRALCYGTAAWAVDSTLDFLNEFYNRVETDPPYSAYEERMLNELDTNWKEIDPQW